MKHYLVLLTLMSGCTYATPVVTDATPNADAGLGDAGVTQPPTCEAFSDPEIQDILRACDVPCPRQFQAPLPEPPFPDEYRDARHCIREYRVRCSAILTRSVEYGEACSDVMANWIWCTGDLETACPDTPWLAP